MHHSTHITVRKDDQVRVIPSIGSLITIEGERYGDGYVFLKLTSMQAIRKMEIALDEVKKELLR